MDKQLWGLKYMKKGYTEQTYESRNKTNKNQGFWVTASRTLEQVCIRMSSACMHKLDHAYADPYLETLINTKTQQKPNKIQKHKSSNLTC